MTHAPLITTVCGAAAASLAHVSAISDLLEQVADEFYPPLTQRTSTTQSQLAGGADVGLGSYLTGVLEQETIVAWEGDAALGFASYRHMTHPELADLGQCVYLSTIATRAGHRGKGVARTMYAALFDTCPGEPVLLRTWSTNSAHLALLAALGFTEVRRVGDDRGPGVDTVYLHRAGS